MCVSNDRSPSSVELTYLDSPWQRAKSRASVLIQWTKEYDWGMTFVIRAGGENSIMLISVVHSINLNFH